MRDNKEYSQIRVSSKTHNRLNEIKAHFQDEIGGGVWTFDDTIIEILTILKSLE